MAKEMIIVFVYDTKSAEDTETDNSDGIMYFHPNWVPEQQRTALCGQVMGTAHCLKSIFSAPRIVALQTGKFFISDFSRYVLVVGTDRNVNDWVLEYRANLLTSLLKFYHKDLEFMSELYTSTETFITKLYCVFETYLNLLIYGHGGNIFNNVLSLQLPKSASCVYLESVQILRSCQRINSVLGGILLYHNKVVTTQLSAQTTKWLVLTNPYHLKLSSETVKTGFDLPMGTKLLQVYINEDEFERLKKDANILKAAKQYFIDNNNFKANPVKEQVLSKMKRDQSLIFTTVPEEGAETSTVTLSKPTKTQNRPKFLNLKLKTTDIKTEVKSVTTPFQGNTSICSTPLSELNKVLHQNLMSICINLTPKNEKIEEEKRSENVEETNSLNSLLSAISDIEKVQEDHNGNQTPSSYKKFFSCDDLTKATDENLFENSKRIRRTITDPTFPVFSYSGLPISDFLHKELIFNNNIYNFKSIEQKRSDLSSDVWKSFQDFDSCIDQSEKMDKAKIIPTKNSMEKRKSLTLPLKPTTELVQVGNSLRQNSILTPLMSKLSILAMEEKSSGFCTSENSPSDQKDFKSALKRSRSFFNGSLDKDQVDIGKVKLKAVSLFICGQQDVVVGLFLDQKEDILEENIHEMYETCTDSLGKLDKKIRQCLEAHPGGSQNDSNDPYGYLCLNPDWDTTQKSGVWDTNELNTVSYIHRDFLETKNLTEVIIRGDIYVIYGNNCGMTEVFYNQTTSVGTGLPTPADPMGVISLKVKRRLERDHAIVLH